MAELLIPVLITIAVFIGILYIVSRTGDDENVRSRLDRMAENTHYAESANADYTGGVNPDTAFLEDSDQRSGIAIMGENFLRMVGKDPRQVEKEKQLDFIQAGIYSPSAIGVFYFFRVVALPIALLVAFILITGHSEGIMRLLKVGGALLFVFLAWFGPSIYLTNLKQKRQKVLTRSFPDTLDLILVCVESGLALDAALARVCRELDRAHPEITKELNRTRMELTLLSDRSVALQNLSERTDLVAFRSLVAALMQTEKFGTSLTETLRVLSDDYRNTRLMVAENKAGKLPALMTIPMILLMMPAFMMIILGPAILQFMEVWGDGIN